MSQLFPAGGARIARGMFAYVSVMAALATLSPFDFQLVPEREFAVLWLFNDVLINLLLLFPVGFLFALAFEGRVGPRGLHALWFGLAFSLCLEYAQQFLPSRHSNLVDVLTNGLGCWAGALGARRVGRWLGGFLSEDLVLELPLTGALYLLAPLLMLHGLGAGKTARPWVAVPLALFGATVLAALYQQRIARAGTMSPARFAAYGALAFAGAALPALLRRPAAIVVGAACLQAATWAMVKWKVGWSPSQRRFEASTVRRALPWFVLYLVGLVAFPFFDQAGGAPGGPSHLQALRLLESFAALAVYGYLISQLVSRAPWAPRALVGAVATSGLAVSILLEYASAEWASPASRLLRLTVLGVSATAGAALHRAQVGLVQALRAQSPRRPSAWPSREAGAGAVAPPGRASCAPELAAGARPS